MSDTPPRREKDGRTYAGTDIPSPPGMPHWVRITLIVIGVVAAAALVIVVLQIAGVGVNHGPGRHSPGLNAVDGQSSPVEQKAIQTSGDDASADPGGHTPPIQHGP